ncbi:MAG: hypothetical protein ACRCVJ_17915 [Clostridium sp.]|uniref:hypothetical protein n=1 Tax=Clostridium sp. TaxID=1506 RepID=UPI003F2CCF3B
MSTDEKISKHLRTIIKNKFGNMKNAAVKLKMNERYLENIVYKIKIGEYPSIKKLKEIAKVCECEITDFFKVD